MFSPEMMKMASEAMANMTPEQMQMANMDPAAMQAQMAQAQAMMSNMSPDAMRQQFQTAGEQIKNLSPDELAAQTAAAQAQVGAQGDYMVTGANGIKEEGNALHRQGKFAEAAEKYQAAKRNLEGNDSAAALQVKKSCSLNLASCYLKTGQHDLVVEECGLVIRDDAHNLKALYRRGQAYAALGRHSMAESDLAAAQRVNPQDEHVAAALQDVRAKLAAAGDGGDDDVDSHADAAGVGSGLAALAAAMNPAGGAEGAAATPGESTQKDEEDEGGGKQDSDEVSGGLAALAAAMKSESGEEEQEEEAAGSGPTRADLQGKSINELREVCMSKDLAYPSCVDKHDIIDPILSNPRATAPAPAATAAAPATAIATGGGLAAGMSQAQLDQAKKMMENAIGMMKGMDPAALANMFNMRDGSDSWTPEMAKQHVAMLEQPGVLEQASQQMKNLSPDQIAGLAQQGAAAAANGGIVPPGMSSMPDLKSPYTPAAAAAPAASVGRVDVDDVRSTLTAPAPAPAAAPAGAGAAAGMANLNPQMKAQMEMMKNDPEMLKQSVQMMQQMDSDTMAKMLESQSAMTGMKVTPEMAKMSAQMMKNMDPAAMEKMMSMAGSMGAMGGGAHQADAAGAGAAAPAGGAPGGMGNVEMDPATGMPVVTPEMQKQMSSMMRDPEMRKNISNMMKNMDPEMLKGMGITDKAQIEKATEALEKLSPEQVDKLMSGAMYLQRVYLFYKNTLWFRCLLQLVLMYIVYWLFGGLAMRALSYLTGSGGASSPAATPHGQALGSSASGGVGPAERDWSGKAHAIVDDDDDDDVLSAPETKHGRNGAPVTSEEL